MNAIRQVSWSERLLVLAVAAVVALSAREALAATNSLRRADCEATNWCSGSNPDGNCRDCCRAQQFEDGFCYSYDPGIQGCLCI